MCALFSCDEGFDEDVKLTNWKVPNATDMRSMFHETKFNHDISA